MRCGATSRHPIWPPLLADPWWLCGQANCPKSYTHPTACSFGTTSLRHVSASVLLDMSLAQVLEINKGKNRWPRLNDNIAPARQGRKGLAGAICVAATNSGHPPSLDGCAPKRATISRWKPLERARRIERPTLTLARLCSTPELRPRSKGTRVMARTPALFKGLAFGAAPARKTPCRLAPRLLCSRYVL